MKKFVLQCKKVLALLIITLLLRFVYGVWILDGFMTSLSLFGCVVLFFIYGVIHEVSEEDENYED